MEKIIITVCLIGTIVFGGCAANQVRRDFLNDGRVVVHYSDADVTISHITHEADRPQGADNLGPDFQFIAQSWAELETTEGGFIWKDNITNCTSIDPENCSTNTTLAEVKVSPKPNPVPAIQYLPRDFTSYVGNIWMLRVTEALAKQLFVMATDLINSQSQPDQCDTMNWDGQIDGRNFDEFRKFVEALNEGKRYLPIQTVLSVQKTLHKYGMARNGCLPPGEARVALKEGHEVLMKYLR